MYSNKGSFTGTSDFALKGVSYNIAVLATTVKQSLDIYQSNLQTSYALFRADCLFTRVMGVIIAPL
jgi:hypothetical protein